MTELFEKIQNISFHIYCLLNVLKWKWICAILRTFLNCFSTLLFDIVFFQAWYDDQRVVNKVERTKKRKKKAELEELLAATGGSFVRQLI